VKSTLLGHLLRLAGTASVDGGRRAGNHQQKSRGTSRPRQEKNLAWTTDEDHVEQERGVTIDIATKHFRGRSSKVMFSVIDAPGHRDFVPAMILGACLANAAILVVDASFGEFESGFSKAGQTREHALLIRALGISRLIVVVNKMDVVEFSQIRYSEIRTALTDFLSSIGWKVSTEVEFLPASGLCGVNLVAVPGEDHPLRLWYRDGTLLDILEDLPPADAESIAAAMSRPTRMVISDVFKSSSHGGDLAVCGRLICGTVAVKDKLVVSPSAEIAQVKSIRVGLNSRPQNDRPVVAGADNLSITLGLIDIPGNILIQPGDVLCDPANAVPVVSRFRARILVLETSSPLVQGTQVDLHLGGLYEAATISRLNQLFDPKLGISGLSNDIASTKNCRPRRLVKGNSAVVEISVSRKICAELGVENKFLGRFALRSRGSTIGVGVVTDLLM
jgi:elongation factor 1 alpha-like protein